MSTETPKITLLLNEYGESHQNKINVLIHKICVPLIVFSVIGLLWVIPTPSFLSEKNINFAHLTALLVFAYYLSLSLKYFLFMIPILGSMLFLARVISNEGMNLFLISLLIFIISWIFQFIGHKIEGKKPSFFKDLLFLLVGPLWVAKSLFRLKD